MRVTRLVEQKIDVAAVRAVMPNAYHDEDEDPFETGAYPGPGYDRASHVLTLVFDLDTGKVRDWPTGAYADVRLKVRDAGTYELLDSAGAVVATLAEDYVPLCLPGGGDYIEASIAGDGTVLGWRPDAEEVVEGFRLGAQRRGRR